MCRYCRAVDCIHDLIQTFDLATPSMIRMYYDSNSRHLVSIYKRRADKALTNGYYQHNNVMTTRPWDTLGWRLIQMNVVIRCKCVMIVMMPTLTDEVKLGDMTLMVLFVACCWWLVIRLTMAMVQGNVSGWICYWGEEAQLLTTQKCINRLDYHCNRSYRPIYIRVGIISASLCERFICSYSYCW